MAVERFREVWFYGKLNSDSQYWRILAVLVIIISVFTFFSEVFAVVYSCW